jgi:hypothetical protein
MKLLMENWRKYLKENQISLQEGLGGDWNQIVKMAKAGQTTKHLPQNKEERTPEQELEFRDILDNKRDAHRHILASAYFTTKFGGSVVKNLGELIELIGALKNKLKAGSFDSGWAMDSANNQIGIDIGKENPAASLNDLNQIVSDLINSGDFYTADGQTLYKDM